MTSPLLTLPKRALCGVLILVAAGLSACSDKAKDKKPGQALASVNGAELTVLQLNEEMQRSGVNPAQQDAAAKQLLQVLIDRQLLDDAARKEKLDRDPKVMGAIDRARSLILAQAYLQKRVGNVAHPTAADVEEYYNKHPEFFGNRKQFSMNELVVSSQDLTPEVRAAADSAKSLEEVAVWLDGHHLKYGRTQISRSTADLPPALSSRLLGMPKGQIFVVKEGPRSMFISVGEVKDAPVALPVAQAQIEQFLVTQKNKDAASAEIERLRAAAKIDYLNKSMAPDAKPGNRPAVGAAVAQTPPEATASADKAALARGVAGLK